MFRKSKHTCHARPAWLCSGCSDDAVLCFSLLPLSFRRFLRLDDLALFPELSLSSLSSLLSLSDEELRGGKDTSRVKARKCASFCVFFSRPGRPSTKRVVSVLLGDFFDLLVNIHASHQT